jgi:hypothetical protein
LILLLSVLTGCPTPGYLKKVIPPKYDYRSSLTPSLLRAGESDEMAEKEREQQRQETEPVPIRTETGTYTVEKDGSVTFDRGEVRVTLRYMNDAELNERYPKHSYRGEFSANPFTYGDWRDPRIGYTPNRFTVFSITVHNVALPKVQLDPGNVTLFTDRGDELTYYAIYQTEAKKSFENYYLALRGSSGNEIYRFEERMGIVRADLYRPDHRIFKGDDYSGLIAFDPLHPDVRKVRMVIRRFIVRFDAYNNPAETIDISFDFDRHVEKKQIE